MNEVKKVTEPTRVLGGLVVYSVLAMTVGAGLFIYGVVADSNVYAGWGAGVFVSPVGVMTYVLVVHLFFTMILPEGLNDFNNWRSNKVTALGSLAFSVWSAFVVAAIPVVLGARLVGWETIETAGWYVLLGCLAVGFPVLIIGTIFLVVWTKLQLDISRPNG